MVMLIIGAMSALALAAILVGYDRVTGDMFGQECE
jgi:hypothetical protein